MAEGSDSIMEIYLPSKRAYSSRSIVYISGEENLKNYQLVCRSYRRKIATKGDNNSNLMSYLCDHNPLLAML